MQIHFADVSGPSVNSSEIQPKTAFKKKKLKCNQIRICDVTEGANTTPSQAFVCDS